MNDASWPEGYSPMSPEFCSALDAGHKRLVGLLASLGDAGAGLAKWMDGVFAGNPVAAARLPHSFPALLGPHWVDPSVSGCGDTKLHSAIGYSTICGYLFIRLVDNTVDGDADAPPELLPMLALLAREFERPYFELFPLNHPFWAVFDEYWGGVAVATTQDAMSPSIDARTFLRASARKSMSAIIPIAATCYFFGLAEWIPRWQTVGYRLSRWHQFHSDVLHWSKDASHGNATFVLSCADNKRWPGESLEEWMLRDGYAWATRLSGRWFGSVVAAAEQLPSERLNDYLRRRESLILDQYVLSELHTRRSVAKTYNR